MAIPGGTIRINLTISAGRVVAVRIGAREVDSVARVFEGMTVAEVPGRIGAMYSLCSKAQTIAALQAIEAATGMRVPDGVRAARDVLRLSEMLTQTAMRLALHWPKALGLAMQPDLVRDCMAAEKKLETALFGGAEWQVPGAGLSGEGTACDPVITRLALSVEEFTAQTHLQEVLKKARLERFGVLPEGLAPEQGVLTRQWDAPEVACVRAALGSGLAARLTASRAELAAQPGQISAAMEQVSPAVPVSPLHSDGEGVAEVETARGPLRHWAKVAKGRIATYGIDAPTEMNFRPGGPVEAGLIGAPEAGIEQAAQLHILAIDPCVEFTLELSHA